MRARRPGSAVGGRSRPGKESVAKRSLACLTAMRQLGVLGGLLPVAREPAEVRGDGRVRVAGENTILRDGELRSFAPGARVVVIPRHVEKLAPGGVGGPLDVGCVEVERVMIATGPDRVTGHAGVGDRPVSRGGAGDRLCCVREESRTDQRTPTEHIRLRTARRARRPWGPPAAQAARSPSLQRDLCHVGDPVRVATIGAARVLRERSNHAARAPAGVCVVAGALAGRRSASLPKRS